METDTGEIKLNSGRIIYLCSLDQYRTYGGLIEGLPTKEINEEIIMRAVAEAKKHYDIEPYLIQPTQQLYKPERYEDRRGDDIPMTIPNIICVGVFESKKPARDFAHDISMITIVWFQNAFAFPIDEIVMSRIKMINWEVIAQDCSI